MILRRVIAHVRKQEWTAIAIDFAIVVIGVFVGLQVSNWNVVRADRQREGAFLQRLHDDVVSRSSRSVKDARSAKDTATRLQEVRTYLEADANAPRVQLGNAHCSAIARSHIYASSIVTPPTIRELFESGGIGLIQDAKLRTAIIRFEQIVEIVSQLRNDLTQDRRLLGREYPDHITVGLRDWQDSECNFAAMAADRAFRNDFADTLRRYGAYANSVVAPLDSGQRDLHALLDARLGIVH